MISKELLEAVFNKDIDGEIEIVDNNVFFDETDLLGKFFTTNGKYDSIINIHELSAKCKDWLLFNDYIFDIYTTCDGIIIEICVGDDIVVRENTEVLEYKAVFKATEWILDN